MSRTASMQNDGFCTVPSRAKSAPPRSGNPIADRCIAAAVACGLTRREAKELLAETLAAGIAVALNPAGAAQIKRALDNQTIDIALAAADRRAA